MNRVTSIVVLALVAAAGSASASITSIKLTTNALGLGNTDINYASDGQQADADIPGKLYISPVTGQGSVLRIQTNGQAGSGVPGAPLFATLTARSHLDTTTGLPAVNDYQAGIITLTNENTSLPDGKDEGLGVRAFRVNGATALRTFGANGRPLIEGSKEISGGTGPTAYNPADPNGPPHVDEDVLVTFDSAQQVAANSVFVTVSKFEAADKIWLTVNFVGGAVYTNTFLGLSSGAFSLVPGGATGDNAYNISFGALGFATSAVVESFSIRAVDDDPANPRGSAEHFLLTGFGGEVIPAPGAVALFGVGTLLMARRRR